MAGSAAKKQERENADRLTTLRIALLATLFGHAVLRIALTWTAVPGKWHKSGATLLGLAAVNGAAWLLYAFAHQLASSGTVSLVGSTVKWVEYVQDLVYLVAAVNFFTGFGFIRFGFGILLLVPAYGLYSLGQMFVGWAFAEQPSKAVHEDPAADDNSYGRGRKGRKGLATRNKTRL